MTLHRLKIKDLDAQFIQKLKDSNVNEETEITIWLNSTASNVLSEAKFWALIDGLAWGDENSNQAVITPVVKKLSELSIEEIRAFEDILSEKLYLLDGEKYARHIGENAYQDGKYFSPDSFLYARCCVVANGKEFYETVLQQPEKMPKDLTFGALLRIPAEAFELKTGKEFKHTPAFLYETYANISAWNQEDLESKVLDA